MANEAVEKVLNQIEDSDLKTAIGDLMTSQNETHEKNIADFQSKTDKVIADMTKENRDFQVEIAGLKDAAASGSSSVELSESAKELTTRLEREDAERKTTAEFDRLKGIISKHEGDDVEASKTRYKEEGMSQELIDLIETPKDAKAYYAVWKASGGASGNKAGSRDGAGGTGSLRSTGSSSEDNRSEMERVSGEMEVLFPSKTQ